MATYCDPTVETVQDKSCEFPDSRLLDLRKGTNPRFLAYQANRVRYQRTKQVNDMARKCEGNLSNCQYTPVTHKTWKTDTSNGGMNIYKQSLSDQPNYILGQNGEYVPSGRLEIQRRTHLDYVASVDQGQTIGDAKQQEFFRNNQRDARQCLLYGTRCGALSNAGVPTGLPSKDAGLNPPKPAPPTADNEATLGDESKAQRPRAAGTEGVERRGLGYDDVTRGN
jgi:hypothetical protein